MLPLRYTARELFEFDARRPRCRGWYDEGVQFSPELRDGVVSGRITVSFRLWTRPKVKVGGRYPVGSARIEVDSIVWSRSRV